MKIKGHKLTALGINAGIGSPLVGAQEQGFKVLGNVESRSFFYLKDDLDRNTFTENFNAPMQKTEIVPPGDVTIMAGLPKCGTYSNLVNLTGQDRQDLKTKKSTQLEPTLQYVAKVKPLFFFMDNLPKFLGANHISIFHDFLPDYDIHPALVSNAGYGNCQWNRNRLFIIMSRKELKYTFIPQESYARRTLGDVIESLDDKATKYNEIQHTEHTLVGSCKGGYRIFGDRPMEWHEAREYFMKTKAGMPLSYLQSETREVKHHFGYCKCAWDKSCRTLTGITPKMHPKTCLPLSPRERARVMGFPDDFIFYGLKHEPDGTWRHHNNIGLMRQTGNCVPVEFPTFLTNQFIAALKQPKKYKKLYKYKTSIKPNPLVEEAKDWVKKNLYYRGGQ